MLPLPQWSFGSWRNWKQHVLLKIVNTFRNYSVNNTRLLCGEIHKYNARVCVCWLNFSKFNWV